MPPLIPNLRVPQLDVVGSLDDQDPIIERGNSAKSFRNLHPTAISDGGSNRTRLEGIPKNSHFISNIGECFETACFLCPNTVGIEPKKYVEVGGEDRVGPQRAGSRLRKLDNTAILDPRFVMEEEQSAPTMPTRINICPHKTHSAPLYSTSLQIARP